MLWEFVWADRSAYASLRVLTYSQLGLCQLASLPLGGGGDRPCVRAMKSSKGSFFPLQKQLLHSLCSASWPRAPASHKALSLWAPAASSDCISFTDSCTFEPHIVERKILHSIWTNPLPLRIIVFLEDHDGCSVMLRTTDCASWLCMTPLYHPAFSHYLPRLKVCSSSYKHTVLCQFFVGF